MPVEGDIGIVAQLLRCTPHRVQKLCPTLSDGTRIVVNLSGRGDKDVNTAAKYLEESLSLDGPSVDTKT